MLTKIGRRHFLRGLGGIAVAVPMLEALSSREAWAQTQTPSIRRIITMAYDQGTAVEHFAPTEIGNITSPLPFVTQPLEPYRDNLLIFSRIDNAVTFRGELTFGHPGKSQAALTGTLPITAFDSAGNVLSSLRHVDDPLFGADPANGPSVDQRVGESMYNTQDHVYRSIDLAVNTESGSNEEASRFFFESAGNPATMHGTPQNAFEAYFAGLQTAEDEAAEEAIRMLRRRDKSVLDAVRDSYLELRSGLGLEDRRRLEEHAERVRQVEVNARIVGACGLESAHSWEISPYQTPMTEWAPPQIEILAAAMACDLAPVGRLEFRNQHAPFFGIPAVDDVANLPWPSGGSWHAMVHSSGENIPGTNRVARPYLDEDTGTIVGEYDTSLLQGYRFFVQMFADLVSALDSIDLGGGVTALDNTLLLLTSDFGNGAAHHANDMCYLLAGNLGDARSGFHIDGKANGPQAFYNTNHVLNTVLRICDVRNEDDTLVDDFGLDGFARGSIDEAF